MAHFAELDENNTVINVIVVSNDDCLDADGNESELIGIDFLENLFGHRRWVQTSYNGNIRGKYAGIGDTYDKKKNKFIAAPQPEVTDATVD